MSEVSKTEAPGEPVAGRRSGDDEAFLSVRDLRIHFQTDDGLVKSVDGVSFDVKPGQTLGIVGESGSGKSVTSLGVMGLHRTAPNARISGEVWLDGEELIGATADRVRELRGRKMAMIFQDPLSAMHPYYTVGAQIVEAYRVHNKVSKKIARTRAIEMLDRVGIPEPHKRVDAYPHEFSGGMRQRAMIAMALVNNPELLIADEPTTALDVTVQAQILDLIRDLQKEFGSAVIMITRPGCRRRDGRRAAGDVRRPVHRARPRGAGLLRGPAPVHLGAAHLDAAHRPRADRTADPRQGPAAVADQHPERLRLQPALPVRGRTQGRHHPHHTSRAEAGRRRALLGLPHGTRGAHPDLDRRDCAEAVSEANEVSDVSEKKDPIVLDKDVTIPEQATAPREPLLKVEGLVKHFPIRKGLFGRQSAAVKAVDGIDFEVYPGRPWVSSASPAAASRPWAG